VKLSGIGFLGGLGRPLRCNVTGSQLFPLS